MKMYRLRLFLTLATIVLTLGNNLVQAQSGDQILDGIGETGMISRYVFDGDIKDWSRNNLHAKFHGEEAKFVNDSRFGKVLSLNGEDDSYITIPADGLTDIESISVSGWIYLRSKQSGQRFFDFGKDIFKNFYAAPSGTKKQESFQVTITSLNGENKSANSKEIELNKWVHIAVVVDVPAKSLLTYVNGKPVGEAKNVPIDLSAIFGQQSENKKPLYIGKSQVAGDPNLNALIHDFRVYRISLSSNQVAGIYKNASQNLNEGAVNVTKAEDDLPAFPDSHPQLYTEFLTSVSDVEVETEVGNLPRLPSYVEGTYRNQMNGPKVRVLWPSDTDNSAVINPGTYTITGRVAGTDFEPKATVTVKKPGKSSSPTLKLETFDLGQVSLKMDASGEETKFIENRDKFITTLAETDPDSFLYMFRNAFGQKQPDGAMPLGVWDSQETKLRGHATGHYLTAIAQAYAGTGYDKKLQANFFEKMEYMVNTLYELSQLSGKQKASGVPFVSDPTAVPPGSGKTGYDSDLSEDGIRTDYWNWGKGYISAYPPDQFIMLEQGATYGGQVTQVWAPYYTLHKILAGLIDIYTVSGNEKALEIAADMSDWVHARLSQVPTEQLVKVWNTYIAGEFGGMNESMARLYRITGKSDYLETAQLFDNIRMFFGDTSHTHGLAKNVDVFRGLHANQHIPQVVGSIETYRASNNPEYFKVADNFWYKTVNDYMYSIGGVAGARNPANAECFIAQPATLYENGFSSGGQNETCATYNMLKLTNDLFLFDQRGELMDYYERGLYNHILASIAKDSPANTYHVPLRPGSIKHFGNAKMTGFTCCNGTAIESSTKLQSAIYYKSKDDKALYVNLYIPSTLDWKERDVRIEQTTNFPKEDHTLLTITGSGQFDINVRVPGWATEGFFVKINGKEQKVQAKPGTYLKISRKWKNGDTIELKMPFHFYLDPVMDQQNIASLFYGPVLLAAQEPEARKDWRKIALDAEDISQSIKSNGQPLEFIIEDVVFKPFYESYGRHSVYLDFSLK
ncbi:beta-L-arabinofuranosidase domain-containing protein [Belliella marina]|uniref:Beta-L-arabinofuranosidase domain-containing protein n=1 Tax=Belliella marina TaxID=1644146 RepID=A0ABW4VR84_9BACT